MPDAGRHREGAGRVPVTAVLGSLVVHAVLGAALLRASEAFAPPPPLRTYRVTLAAPAPEEAPRREEPRPAEASEEEHRPPPPRPTERRKPETERPTVVEESPPPEPAPDPATAPEEGEDPLNVKLEGAAFPFPAYLENVIRQVNRYWRRPSTRRALRAEIAFTILADGSVEEIRWIRRSGDLAFDLEARGAIEAAGRDRAFGSLPEGFPRDRLRVSFFFDPTER